MFKYCKEIFQNSYQKFLEKIEQDYENLYLFHENQNIQEIIADDSENLEAIHKVLPLEIFEKVLKNLDYYNLKTARGTCKQWEKFIRDFKLVEKAACKIICFGCNSENKHF